MNQMPSREDCDDVVVSSPNSTNLKREREKTLDFDLERDREMSSRGSDEEEGGTTRKKLRLSKEQSALLEESFKEHSTLNPVRAYPVYRFIAV
jgi:homeobox-leucine zipper protein